jgi:hypothetical protein
VTARRGSVLGGIAAAALFFAQPACAAAVDAPDKPLDRELVQAADQLDATARLAQRSSKNKTVIPALRLPAAQAAPPHAPSLDHWLTAQLDQIRTEHPPKTQALHLRELADSLRRVASSGNKMDIAPPLDVSSVASGIVAGRAYQVGGTGPAPKPHESLLQRFLRWLQDMLGRLFTQIFSATASRPIIGQIAAALFIALLVLAAVYLIYLLASLIARRPKRAAVDEGTPLQERADPDSLYELGVAAAGQGRYAQAVALLFQASLAALDRAGLLPYDGARTPGECRRALRKTASAASPHFDALAQSFVLAAFAERPVSMRDWSFADAAYRSLRPLLAP